MPGREAEPRAEPARGCERSGSGDCFLHTIEPGAASKSYGIEVAKLAGLPSAVIERAKHVLKQHEKAGTPERAGGDRRGANAADDIYAAVATHVDRIEAVDVNALTPLQALNLLEELQQELKEKA